MSASLSEVSAEAYVAFARDPAWQFVGVLLALAAIVLSVWIYLRQKQQRRIAYQRLAGVNVVTVKEHMAGRVTVLFDGTPVKSMHVVTMHIWNSGSLPIVASDFIEPLSLSIEAGARLLSADIVGANPPELHPTVRIDEHAAVVEPLLLNPGDSFVVKLLIQDGNERVLPTGRIIGVRTIDRVMDPDTFSELHGLIGLLLVSVGALIASLTKTPTPDVPKTLGVYIGVSVAIAGGLYWLFHSLRRVLLKRKLSRSGQKGHDA
jgi:hypothetical protein